MSTPKILSHKSILGPWRDYPSGSVERAKALGIEVWSIYKKVDTTVRLWESEKEIVDKERAWEPLGLKSKEDFIKAVTGKPEAIADEVVAARNKHKTDPLPKRGEIGNGRSRSDNITSTRGTSREYTLRRLARDRPDLLDKIEAGEMSTRQAAIAAGIVRPDPPFIVAQKAFRKLEATDKRKFLAWLKNPD